MNPSGSPKILVSFLFLGLFWTGTLIFSLAWHFHYEMENMTNLAVAVARAGMEKDKAYRELNERHGGFYLPVSGMLEPDPSIAGVADRDVVAESGTVLTLVNPSYLSLQLQKLYPEEAVSFTKVRSLSPIRPEDAPDPWERTALAAIQGGSEAVRKTVVMDGEEWLRFMEPLRAGKGCVKNRPGKNLREGDIVGGLSIQVPMKPFRDAAVEHHAFIWTIHGVFWFLGSVGLLASGLAMQRRERERMAAARRMEEVFNELHQIFEATGTGMRLLDKHGAVARTNAAFSRISGKEAPELVGEKCHASLPCPNYRTRDCCVKSILAGERPEDFEMAIERPDGTTAYYLVSSSPMHGADGEIRGIVQNFKDITERKKIEMTLERKEKHYREIVETAPIGIFHTTPEGLIHDANPATARIFGHDSVDDLLRAVNASSMEAFYAEPGRRGEILALVGRDDAWHAFEEEYIARDDRPITVNLLMRGVRDDRGIVLYESFLVDITEKKEAERKLLRAKEEWERTFNGITDILTIQDRDMRIVQVNDAACAALNKSREELVGGYCYELFRGAEGPCPGCSLVKSKRDFSSHSTEIHHPNLEKHFLVTASPLADDAGEFCGIVHIAKDITEFKGLEKQLLQAQKLQAVGVLAGGVAHDFNNLLAGIIGFAELVSRKPMADEQMKEDVNQILALGRRGANLTRQLLAFSRSQTIEPIVLNCDDLLRNLAKMLKRLLGEDIELVLDQRPGLRLVMADPGRLEQVIINLAVNARDAMPRGGTLRISAENAFIDKKHMEMPAGEYVRISVADTGAGIEAPIIDRIFEPFFTTKDVDKGTGLGLSTVYGIVRQHKGSISVSSEPGKGTTFIIYIPSAQGDIMKEATVNEKCIQGHGTILLVEDEASVRETTRRILVDQGYTIFAAGSSREAEALFGEHKEKITLLLTDVVMPGMNGKELFERLRREKPDLRVLYMSGYSENIVDKCGVLPGKVSFIAKPFSAQGLGEKLHEIFIQGERDG